MTQWSNITHRRNPCNPVGKLALLALLAITWGVVSAAAQENALGPAAPLPTRGDAPGSITILPPIKNGDFNDPRPMNWWDWSAQERGYGAGYASNGYARVIDGTALGGDEDVLLLGVSAEASTDSLLDSSGVVAEAVLYQQFSYPGGGALSADVAVGFGVEMSSGSMAQISVRMEAINHRNGTVAVAQILDTRLPATPGGGAAIMSGFQTWQPATIDLAACEAEPGDLLEVAFYVVVSVGVESTCASINVGASAMIDNVHVGTTDGSLTGGDDGPSLRPSPALTPSGPGNAQECDALEALRRARASGLFSYVIE